MKLNPSIKLNGWKRSSQGSKGSSFDDDDDDDDNNNVLHYFIAYDRYTAVYV